MVEGAAGVAVAAFMKAGAHYRGKKVAILLCGRNLSLAQFKTIIL
jgi:threonine dehydratase